MYSSVNTSAQKTPNYILVVFIAIQFVLIVLFAISIPQLFISERIGENEINRQPQISIDNISKEIPSLYTDNINHIQRVLFNVVESTSAETYTSLTSIISTDTIKTLSFDLQNTDYFSATISIPEMNQKYQIFYSHTSVNGNEAPNDFISILCAPESSGCLDADSQSSRPEIIARFLQYFNFNYFSTFMDSSSPTVININPTKRDITDSEKESYIRETKEAVSSLGISPDLFTYKVVQPSDFNYFIPPEDR